MHFIRDKLKKSRFLIVSMGLALGTLLLYHLTSYNSTFVEQWFTNGWFKIYRSVWDNTIAFLPLPLIYIVVIATIIYLLFPLFYFKSRRKLGELVRRLLILGSIAVIIFYWLWGFNYKRNNLSSVLELKSAKPDEEFVFSEYCRVIDSLYKIRKEIIRYDASSEESLRDDLHTIFDSLNIAVSGRVRVRKIRPKGILLRISTAGVYLPFVGEGHIDAGLHPITHPFTMIHEMSHGYGWTGEDDCNFIALIACLNSPNLFTRYSGYFSYWRYLRSQAYLLDKDRFDSYYRFLPSDVAKDYREVLSYQNRYPDILPAIRDLIYDNYLKSHGISEGMKSYSRMIVLSQQWQLTYGSLVL